MKMQKTETKNPNSANCQGHKASQTPVQIGNNSMNTLPQVMPLTQDAQTMSSREIAELTRKEHKNVLRVIRELIDDQILDAQIEPLKFEYRGQWFDYYELNKRDSIVVVARLCPEYMAQIVDRWQELETKESKPAQVKTDKGSLKLGSIMRQCVMMAKACGLKGNQAVISADHAVQKITGESPLQLLGATHLVAPVQEQSFTPTQLGELFEPKISGRAINTLLAENGYQTKESDYWVMTKQGESFGELLDTGKKHSNGTPVKQLKWYQSIVDKLAIKSESEAHLTVLAGGAV
jgi:phage regulator Rha-like protein